MPLLAVASLAILATTVFAVGLNPSTTEHLSVMGDDDAVQVHIGEQNRRGTTKADHIPAYRARFDRDPTPENGFLLARLLPAAESEALVLRLLADHPYNPWLLRLGARHHLRARRWSEAVRAYERLVQVSPADIVKSFELRATALAGAGRAEEALWLADRLPLGGAHLRVALTYARLVKLVGAGDPSGYVKRVSQSETLPPGFLASFETLTGGDALAEITAIAGAPERKARMVEREALRKPWSALALLAQAPEGTAGELDLDVAVLLLGAAEGAKLSRVRDQLVSALEEHGPPFLDYIRTGRENSATDELPPAGLAAIHVARALTLDGSERDALLSLARQEDPLRGVPSLAAEELEGKAPRSTPSSSKGS
ncbi:hypothetical protein AKJ08_3113 [Vulgatibacter incomptus]|uniref:Tetratricopeptide repeat protein n=1 Tax=Vulgatibacter incomptus TaxID=1391653 RepID=A0A0K1PH53_9BACT|nr:hypothetical protein AKJ08_3113 [Vulgatibacter incomptus]